MGSLLCSRVKPSRESEARPTRRIASWALMLGGVVVAVQHVLAHGGLALLPISMGWQDVAVGYPMALLMFVAGAMLLDPHGGA